MFTISFSEAQRAMSAADSAATEAAAAGGADALAKVSSGMPGSRSASAADVLGAIFTAHVAAWTTSVNSYAQAMGTHAQTFSTLDAVRAAAFEQAGCRPRTGAGS